MKKILLVILMLCVYQKSYSRTLIFEDFNDESRISFKSNISITNSNVILSNFSLGGETGYCISSNIIKPYNTKWDMLFLNYFITNFTFPPAIPKFNLIILNQDKTVLSGPYEFFYNSVNSIDLGLINSLNDLNVIKLKILLYCGTSGNKATPKINSYEITINDIQTNTFTSKNKGLTGAPSPFKVDNNSFIRFYYKFEKDCNASLKIYDTNYNMIKVIFENQIFRSGSDLDGTWDGKNGNNVKVLSGVYIAILEIDGSTSGVDPFIFALIR